MKPPTADSARPPAVTRRDALKLGAAGIGLLASPFRSDDPGRAVAAVKNGTCQGCGLGASNRKVQQARAGTELVYCGTCGRILYVP